MTAYRIKVAQTRRSYRTVTIDAESELDAHAAALEEVESLDPIDDWDFDGDVGYDVVEIINQNEDSESYRAVVAFFEGLTDDCDLAEESTRFIDGGGSIVDMLTYARLNRFRPSIKMKLDRLKEALLG